MPPPHHREDRSRIPENARRSVGAVLVLAAMSMLAGGCTTTESSGAVNRREVSAANGPATAHVSIYRGLFGVMPGCKTLQAKLAGRGISSRTWVSADAREVAREILECRKSGDRRPIILMGYAVGGGGVRKTARLLGKEGVTVDAVVLIDPSFFEPVPRNVGYCFVAHRPEVWQMWNPIMRGNPVRKESDATRVVHRNLGEEDATGALDGVSHVTITRNAWVQDLLVTEVVGIAGGGARSTPAVDAGWGELEGK